MFGKFLVHRFFPSYESVLIPTFFFSVIRSNQNTGGKIGATPVFFFFIYFMFKAFYPKSTLFKNWLKMCHSFKF
ncbi:hypothetical protein DQM68_00735 [Leptospira mayottensis]|uniref:Uncharacterized protein n=2 Tax=Leptospira mayottensis TaxID=1137606 RepID=A0AA87MRW5_9LEPT|nr:hypothetical protein DQM68_00735 [Leptospira mayottensis]AZQ01222.1 hypothetical protein LEP1GSC190_03260 [Leptospira mayottensis 200901116]EKS01183.1 hypothetical protein LEP1GSC125_1134 [Leptospira mayottensis 200901122]AXR65981.1 hypothetical protein DQM28_02355 [Leptospira mayottensis]AXR69666.1 hypothetical protein DPV73_02225 [Leptospira mayottensis]